MADVIFGSNAYMECKIGGTYKTIGCAVSCSFSFQNELIGRTDRNAGLFRKRRVRMSDMSMSLSGLLTIKTDTVLSSLYFLNEGVRRTEQDLRINYEDEGGEQKQIQGIFLVESMTTTSDTQDFTKFDLSFVGTSQFSITGIDVNDPTEEGFLGFDWWNTTPGATSVSGIGARYGRSLAGHDIVEVDREGTQYDEGDTPVGRFFTYNGTSIQFDPANPFNPGERVFVVWQGLDS